MSSHQPWKNVKKKTRKRNFRKKKLVLNDKEFPSLPKKENIGSTNVKSNNIETHNVFQNLVWVKSNDDHLKDVSTIYSKALNGATLFSLYPRLENSPEFPLFR